MTNKNLNDNDLQSVERDIKYSVGVALCILTVIPSIYFWNFRSPLSSDGSTWGTFGDFIGGTLNPIMAALAFYWLTSSIRLQLKELQETRQQIAEATKAQQESAIHQESIAKLEKKNVQTQKEILQLQTTSLKKQTKAAIAQRQQIAIQNFESLFFQLLSTLNNITNNIQAGAASIFKSLIADRMSDRELKDSMNFYLNKFSLPNNPAVKGKESIKDQIIFYKAFVTHPWDDFYNKAIDEYFGSYFRVCYQITKLIDNSEILLQFKDKESDPFSIEQKKYFDIFRAQLSSYELEAIFFNCLSSHGNEKFKGKVERYGLFEHVLLDHERIILSTDPDITISNRLTMYAYKYDRSAFEENKLWLKYFNELESIEKNDYKKIKLYIRFLISNSILSKNYFHKQYDFENISKKISDRKKSIYKELMDIPSEIREYRDKIKYNYDFIKYHKKYQITQYQNINKSKQDILHSLYLIHNKKIKLRVIKEKYKEYNSIDCLKELSIILKYKIDFDEYCEYMESQQKKANPP